MKRPALSPLLPAVLFAAACLAGCDSATEQTVVTYNPRLDGVSPPAAVTPDLSILEDQKHRYDNESKYVKTGPAAPAATGAPASPAAGGAPAAPAAGNGAAEPGAGNATPAAPSPPPPPAE
jgi:hypothetical protein